MTHLAPSFYRSICLVSFCSRAFSLVPAFPPSYFTRYVLESWEGTGDVIKVSDVLQYPISSCPHLLSTPARFLRWSARFCCHFWLSHSRSIGRSVSLSCNSLCSRAFRLVPAFPPSYFTRYVFEGWERAGDVLKVSSVLQYLISSRPDLIIYNGTFFRWSSWLRCTVFTSIHIFFSWEEWDSIMWLDSFGE